MHNNWPLKNRMNTTHILQNVYVKCSLEDMENPNQWGDCTTRRGYTILTQLAKLYKTLFAFYLVNSSCNMFSA